MLHRDSLSRNANKAHANKREDQKYEAKEERWVFHSLDRASEAKITHVSLRVTAYGNADAYF